MRFPVFAIIAWMLLSVTAAAAKDIPVRVFVDGKERRLNPPAITRDGTTYVPLRAGAEALGATVKWDARTSTATVTLNSKRARIRQGQGIMVNGSLFLPLRLMGESLDCEVKWDAKAKAVRITSKQEVCPPSG